VRILAYCIDFLGYQLRSVGVELEASQEFRSFQILEAEAVVFPVFVNLIDNAIYWLRGSDERRILLDVREDVVTVCDTGPGIHPTNLYDIFEPFVTYKVGGRGLGLYIARANLERHGHEIWATQDSKYRVLDGACFCIRFHKDVLLTE
jgi:signal transduction histidine kinase